MDSQICALYESGLTGEMVAEELGISCSHVYRVLHAVGTVRSHGEAMKLAYAKGRAEPVHNKDRTGENNPNWKGGRFISNLGYWLVKSSGHPRAMAHGNYVLEHRLVMEAHLGRYLDQVEIVHHINGVITDNRIENLRLMSRAEHQSYHRRLYLAELQVDS